MGKLKSTSRNRTEEVLVIERVVNGLKYSQGNTEINLAANQLIAYAVSMKGQAGFLSENSGNQEKLTPWFPQIFTLLFASDHLGLSSLHEFKNAMKGINQIPNSEQYINPEIKGLLSPSPSPYEINVYIL